MSEQGAGESAENDARSRKPLWLRWWEFKAWFHRCPECGHGPDKHYDSPGPRWERDQVARMLGIAYFGCPRCGHGAIEERDRGTCRSWCVEVNHPSREHDQWVSGSVDDEVDMWNWDEDR